MDSLLNSPELGCIVKLVIFRRTIKQRIDEMIKNITYFLLFLTIVLLSTDAASANAAPPPAVLWFSFQDESGSPVSPDSLQLIGCLTESCVSETLLSRYGNCALPGCLPGEPSLQGDMDQLACADALCRATSRDYPTQIFRLVANINGQVYTSKPARLFSGDAIRYQTEAYQVIMSIPGLNLSNDPDFVKPGLPSYGINFVYALLLTLLGELLVAWFYLWFVQRWRGAQLVTPLVLVCLANLVTLPLVWFLFPTFVPFMQLESRAVGLFLGLVAVYLSLVFYLAFVLLEGRRRWIIITVNLLVILLVIPVCALIIGYIVGYPNLYKLTSSGLPGSWLVWISEIFAWVYEAFFLYFLSRKTLPLKHALVLSLLMNLTSYLVGMVVLAT